MSDESILGLLLRAHAGLAGQAHGQQYMHGNLSAANHFEHARAQVHGAIESLGLAHEYIARAESKKVPK